MTTTACSVYWIRLPEHTDMLSQGYIGISKNVEKRWKWHRKSKENPHLRSAIDKYGFDTLVKQVILISDKTYCLNLERKLRPSKKIGWNLTEGGGHPPAQRNSASFKKGMTPWNKGVAMPDDVKQKLSNVQKGKQSWNKGIPMSEESKAKVSASKKGKLAYPDAIERMAAVNRGKKRSPELVRKIMEIKKRNKELRALTQEVPQ